jgi:glycosyltransferase involved in cell wall biosynthesis
VSNAPLLSLIIPTRERADTLGFTLATALLQTSSSRDYEVIVSDNLSADQTRQVTEGLGDPRVRYINTGQRLSMCDNYEYGLSHARGDYVLIIGDDDAVVPGAIDALLTLLRAQQQPQIYRWPLHTYDWPVRDQPARVAYLAPSYAQRTIDLKQIALFVVRNGGWKYYELPSPYHAAIPRGLLDGIRSRTGRVFHSTQPDVFTAMALPALADRAIDVGFSISFNGRSSRSNGLGFITLNARANIDRFLREYGNYHLHPSLFPGVPGAANMIPDAILLACDMFPELYGGTTFNYDAMWAFSCRHRFVSHLDVLSKSGKIRAHHPFHAARFLYFSALQEGAVIRRKILDTMIAPKYTGDAMDNILNFAKTLAGDPRLGSK